MSLDRARLLSIEAAANEVLMAQEALRGLDRQRQQNREALGAFRDDRPENRRFEKNCFLQLGLGDQFVSLPVKEAKRRVEANQARVEEERDKKIRPKLKAKLRELHSLNPAVAEIAPSVLELLCKERDEERSKAKEKEDEEKRRKESYVVVGNRLDYSRFDHLDTDTSEEE